MQVNGWIGSIALCALLGACAAESPAYDACKTVPGELVAEAVGAVLVKAELDGRVTNGKVTNSACNYDFANGDWARVSLSDYADVDYAEGFRRGERSAKLSADFGYPIYYDSGSKDLDGMIEPSKRYYVRMGHNARPQTIDKATVTGGVSVITFSHASVENVTGKLVRIAKLVKF